MTSSAVQVLVYFGLPQTGSNFLTLDDPVRGKLDTAAYPLAGVTVSDITSDAYEVSIRRGRNREVDEIDPGMASVRLRNFDRDYDGTYAASPYYGKLTPGKRITISVYGTVIFDGTIEDWNLDWTVEGDADAVFTAVDALGQLGAREFNAWTTTGSQTAGPRLTSILDRSEVNFGANRDLDAGLVDLQADNVSWGSNVLNYAQLVAKSDGGRLFAARTNVLTYRGRLSLFGATAMVTFRDDGTGTPFNGVTTDTGSELLFNRVSVDRLAGTKQTAIDVTSQSNYGPRSYPSSSLTELLMSTDGAALDMATILLGYYHEPYTRVSTITVKTANLTTTQQAQVAALDIGSLVRIVWTPVHIGTALDQYLVVEGFESTVDLNGDHMVTLYTSQQDRQSYLRLDDPIYGRLDANILA